ncbi:MAG: universal stress protein [Melioribacteraceae bacterium]|nr:universal stress protein [Melioribacteraceae bacterium]
MKNILVAISQPEDAQQLISQAVKIAQDTGGKLWIVHVTEADPDDFLAREAGPQYVYDKRAETRKKATSFVNERAREISPEYSISAEGLIIQGAVAKTIKETVEKYNIDLVVAGHRKKDFLYSLFTANRKKDLVDELKIPLLAVPLQIH